MNEKERHIDYSKKRLYHTIISLVLTTILLSIGLSSPVAPVFRVLLIVEGILEYSALVVLLVSAAILYKNIKKWEKIPNGKCASCGKNIEPTRYFPICDKCYIDSIVINYGIRKGYIPAIDAAMYLTEGKELTRKVNWEHVRKWYKISGMGDLGAFIMGGYLLVIFFIILTCLIFYDSILNVYDVIVCALVLGFPPAAIAIGGFVDIQESRFPEYMLNAYKWRISAIKRVEKAAELLGMKPIEAARRIFFFYIKDIKESVVFDIKIAEKKPERFVFMVYPFFYDGFPVDGKINEGEKKRIARVVEEVWLTKKEFAEKTPFLLKAKHYIIFVPFWFAISLFIPALETTYFFLYAILLWAGVAVWVLFSILGMKELVRSRGKKEWKWMLIHAIIIGTALSGLAFSSGGKYMIDILVDGGYVPWVIGRFVGGIMFGLGVGIAVKAVRVLWKWVVAGSVIWGVLSAVSLWTTRWIYMATKDVIVSVLAFSLLNIALISIVGLFLLISGLRPAWASGVAANMLFSDYGGMLAAVMSIL